MDVPPLPPADPLAQDTRAQLFEVLGRLGRAATTDELAKELDLHPNGVRRHLEQMQLAGLIRRESIRQPRGRPKDGWSLDPDARPGGEQPRAYEELGVWLARAIPAGAANLRVMEATGRGIGRELAASGAGADGPPTESGVEDFGRALTWLGFAPHTKPPAEPEPSAEAPAEGIPLPTTEPEDKTVTFVLGNCPYRQAVQENQPAICTLHKGILTGLLDMLEPDAAMTGFHPRNPHTAGCTVDLLLKKRAAKAVEDEAA
jgi:predicted ArsR family transcriptional regulator